MRVRRSFAVMGVIAGTTVLAVCAAAALAEPSFLGFLHSGKNDKPAQAAPPCPRVIGAEPVDMSRCRHRVVKGAAKPKPYPVIPALFPTPGKP